MKILILNGTFGNRYDSALERAVTFYEAQHHEVEAIKIEDLNIAFCTGCWSCWVKTPGRCAHNDDTQKLLPKVIQSDLVIHFTENSVGFATSMTKKIMDKFVPLVHPYIELVDGESHHVKRYEKYPEMGLIFVDDEMNEKDFQLTKNIFDRTALNFKTGLTVAVHTTGEMEGLKDENSLV